MTIISDGGLIPLWEEGRVLYIGGLKGSGKTLLAFQIAEKMLKQGYKLITNSATIWGDDWPEELNEKNAIKAVVIMDEGGRKIRSMQTVDMISTYARKLDTFIIISSHREPHEDVTELSLWPKYNFERLLGLPIYVWEWTAQYGRKRFRGNVIEAGRSGFYGVYDTSDPAEDLGVVAQYIEKMGIQLHERKGRTYILSDVAKGGGFDQLDEALTAQKNRSRDFRETLSLLGNLDKKT